ncbi:MAG TPA: DUF4112 domain-containing protein [Candidatus Gracilibacteria bacterium]|nr:DUF4112 domain-containing protein [Candidatus Gracilibacteria bacterium]
MEKFIPQENPDTSKLDNLKAEIEKLKQMKNSKDRVKLYANLMDKWGADALISLFPTLGDAASSGISSVYEIIEGAKNMGFTEKDYLKVLLYHLIDFGIGQVPLVGDVADYFFKANKKVDKLFAEKLADYETKLKDKMLANGYSSAEIAEILKTKSIS